MSWTHRHIVSSRSSRNGRVPRRIVVHTTEGIMSLENLANYFDHVDASAHLGIDKLGNAIRMVDDADKAWTEAFYNPDSLSFEQVAFARYTKQQWIRDNHLMLLRAAAAISNWSNKYPWIKIKESVNYGVTTHKALGQAGGGHVDPGPNYPMTYVILLARMHFYRKHGWDRTKRLRYNNYKARVLSAQRKYAGRELGVSL